MTIQVASPAGEPLALATGSEYFAFRMTIDHSRSLGSNSCSGCTTPASIRFSSATLGHVDHVDKPISHPESYYSAAGSDTHAEQLHLVAGRVLPDHPRTELHVGRGQGALPLTRASR